MPGAELENDMTSKAKLIVLAAFDKGMKGSWCRPSRRQIDTEERAVREA